MRARVLAVLLVLWAVPARAQHLPVLPPHVDAQTRCVPGGIQSVMDMKWLDQPLAVAVLKAHEAKHVQQIQADRTRCNPIKYQKLLPLEIEAYCDGTAPVLVAQGWNKVEIYQKLLGILEDQFFNHIPVDTVAKAWQARCGTYLEFS